MSATPMMMGETATGMSKARVSARLPKNFLFASSSAAPMPMTVFTGTAISATSADSFSAASGVGLGDLAPERHRRRG